MADKTSTSFEPSDSMVVGFTVGGAPRRRFTATSVTVVASNTQRSLVRQGYDFDLKKVVYRMDDWRSNADLEVLLEGSSPEGLNSSLKLRLNYNDAGALAQQLVDMIQKAEASINKATAQDLVDLRQTLDPPL